MIQEVSRKSGELFRSGLYCAESVLLAISEWKNIQSDLIPKIATGFCSGVSRTSGMCGAVSGAIMSISLFFGRISPEESIDENYEAVQKLLDIFENQFGSSNCTQLIGCDLGTDEGQEYFTENNLFGLCKNLTTEATSMAMSLIEGQPYQPQAP